MEVYFYCSYEHSRRGFFMTRLTGGELAPAEEDAPERVREFFSYDRFQFLWRELCPPVEKPWRRPQCTGSFCGLRELRGQLADGRNGVVNLAFLAGPEEDALLRRTALTILADYDAFRGMLLGWLSAGGPCGYQLNAAAFRQWLERCGQTGRLRRLAAEDSAAARLLPGLQRTQPPRLEREALRLAVCTCAWGEIAEALGGGAVWLLKPRCALTREEFDAAFIRAAPVWEMEAVSGEE